MKTKVIIAGIILAGAATIAVVIDKKDKLVQPVNPLSTSAGIPVIPLAQKDTPKVNPAHGLPGHRCDLAVGAPLPVSAETSAPAAAPPTINMTPQQPTVVKVNPAHGMPGHRCDLQVGAPL